MTIDGFLQFLGLVVAVYALFGVVIRYRLRLFGWWLWGPSLAAFLASVYLLLFNVIGANCASVWCATFELQPSQGLTPNQLAFLIVLVWLTYVGLLPQWKSVGARHLPLLAALVDRLLAQKRFTELVDFIEPHITLISRCARRQFPLQKLRDAVRLHGNPFAQFAKERSSEPEGLEWLKTTATKWTLSALKPIERRLPERSKREEAAQRMLLLLHTNESLVEFLALERPVFCLKLMRTGVYDDEFGDRAFGIMMEHPASQLRRETLLNQTSRNCFFEIDPNNPLIYALFADSRVAEKLEVWRPVGNFPLRLLERDVGGYRNTISAKKPYEDALIHRDPTYTMVRFFDLMVRSAMRDGIEWHMWLFYFDILVEKLLRSMDRKHPDFDANGEFPNFGYYLIYQVFDAYGDWLRAIDCCPEDSVAVRIESTAARHDNGSILKSTILSIGNSMRHLVESETDEHVVTYFLDIVVRYYRDLANRAGGARAREALQNSIISRGVYGPNEEYGFRIRDAYDGIDSFLTYETKDLGAALAAAYPRWPETLTDGESGDR